MTNISTYLITQAVLHHYFFHRNSTNQLNFNETVRREPWAMTVSSGFEEGREEVESHSGYNEYDSASPSLFVSQKGRCYSFQVISILKSQSWLLGW